MNELVLVIAASLSSLVGSPLVQGIKSLYTMVTGNPLQGKPALWTAVGVSIVLGLTSVAVAGGFAPPYPVAWPDWAARIGGSIGVIFAAMTVIFKQLISEK